MLSFQRMVAWLSGVSYYVRNGGSQTRLNTFDRGSGPTLPEGLLYSPLTPLLPCARGCDRQVEGCILVSSRSPKIVDMEAS